MFDFSFFPASLNATANVTIQRAPAADGVPPSGLHLPAGGLSADPDVFTLLRWDGWLSRFEGRDGEMDALRAWAQAEAPVSVKLVSADGGMGKTRLAAEFAKELAAADAPWLAGFARLSDPVRFRTADAGTLVILDYPEEHRGTVDAFLRQIAGRDDRELPRLRILLLSRRDAEYWQPVFDDAGLPPVWQAPPLALGPVADTDAWTIFETARARCAEVKQATPGAVDETAFTAWLQDAPANRRTLFVVAAAVHGVLHPKADTTGIAAPEVVAALVRWEMKRLRRRAENLELVDTLAPARLLALAAVAGGLDAPTIEALAGDPALRLGLPPSDEVVARLHRTGLLDAGGGLAAPTPDLVAAALALEVLGKRADLAPEQLWAAIAPDPADGLTHLSRLAYDAEVTLGLVDDRPRLSDWLAAAVAGRPERAAALEPILQVAVLPQSLLPAAIAAGRTLLEDVGDEAEEARLQNNLANHLAGAGEIEAALAPIRRAVDIYERLAERAPDRFEPDLATGLNNLSNRLAEAGETGAALAPIRRAVEIREKLADRAPKRFEPDLAASLNNLSNRLAHAGKTEAALAAIRRAVDIREKLAKRAPDRFEPDLAMSLNNLSLHLAEAGEIEAALAPIRRAVNIYKRLAERAPDRFEPDLAQSLNNLSNRLAHAGKTEAALEAIRRAVDIREKLAERAPDRFEPDLATSLGLQGKIAFSVGDPAAARTLWEEARRRVAPHAARNPNGWPGRVLGWIDADLARLDGEDG